MKNLFYPLCFSSILLLLFSGAKSYAQTSCELLTPDCDPPIIIDLYPKGPPKDKVIMIDDAFIDQYLADNMFPNNGNTQVEIRIPADNYVAASFENLDYCRTTIRREGSGDLTFSGFSLNSEDPSSETIRILNCHHLEFDGNGIKVLDAYGTGSPDGFNNQPAVYIGKASSFIDLHHLDVQNPSGFAGIMAKDSPECVNGEPVDIANDTEPFMHNIYIHHNYIHNIPQGEGIYAGDTGFMTGRIRGSCGRLFPQKIENVCIYGNFIEETGLDAVQLGSCLTGGFIYDNFCVEYGTLGDGGMSNGIQIGLGNIGTVCERNFIRQSAERAENAGHAILCQGAGDNCIRNNIVYNTLENAIYVAEQTAYCYRECIAGECEDVACDPVPGDPEATCIGYAYIDGSVSSGLTGISITHNTLMYPAKAANPGIAQIGIRALAFPCRNPATGGAVKNNLIFGTSQTNGVAIASALGITCEENVVVTEDWKTVRDNYLQSVGMLDVDISLPYTSALEDYFTRPTLEEEDNYFRSPVDFYPIHPDITNNATNDCVGSCTPGGDFFGMVRLVTQNCASDYGAVELDFPLLEIDENCVNGTFTVQPADQAGSYSWTFNSLTSTDVNPVFNTPGVGIYPLDYVYVGACGTQSGTLDIELTCSCPCEAPDAVNLNIDAGDGMSWQATEIFNHVAFDCLEGNVLDLSDKCLNIKGRLLIDDYTSCGSEPNIDLRITNGFIRMQPGAEIVVLNDGVLWLQNVNAQDGASGEGIYGCDYMWEGIDVEEGGGLIIRNSTLQDANTAIGITGSASVLIVDNRFENNYRGFDIAPVIDPIANNPDPFSLTMRPDGLSGNFFGTVGGGLKGTLDGTLIPAGTRGAVGIKTSYLNLISSLQPDFANTFEDLYYGIYANQGVLVIGGSTFRQVDYGASLHHTPAVFLANRFEDVALRGIESRNAALLWAVDNEMLDMHQRGIDYRGSENLTHYLISGNTIAAQDHGVNVETSNQTAYLNISGNNLTLPAPTPNGEMFPGRAALRVFNVGNPTLDIPFAQIGSSNNELSSVTGNGHGNSIVLENMSNIEIHNNEIIYQNPGSESIDSYGIHLANSPHNDLYGNAVQAIGVFPDIQNIYVSGSRDNFFDCNSTDGGNIGLSFFGPCDNTALNTTDIGSHAIGLLCDEGATIGEQNHRGNTWLTGAGAYGTAAAEHREIEENLVLSIFGINEAPGNLFRPLQSLISKPNAPTTTWFGPSAVPSTACDLENNPIPSPTGDTYSSKPSDQRVTTGNYVAGDYALVHNWEASLELYERLVNSETLRNSEAWYQNFYTQSDIGEIGDYARVRAQFKALLDLSVEERQNADALHSVIESKLDSLVNISIAYTQAGTEADSTALEAIWLTRYTELMEHFNDWQTLSSDIRQRVMSGVSSLRSANAGLPEHNIPAANEKFINNIQLKRISGEALTERQQTSLFSLAFSCPLEAGNAVYRARTLVRTWGDYVFDDAALCGLGKEGNKSVQYSESAISAPLYQWHIYPNPAKDYLSVSGNKMDALQNVQLLDGLGRPVLYKESNGDTLLEIQLPNELPAGVYFLRLRLYDGEIQTRKILLQP